MFKWLKDRHIKSVNDKLILFYPKMHYRPRKKNAVKLGYNSKIEEIKSHIYSYHKESKQWDSFLIHLKLSLRSFKLSLLQEIKHYSKPRNLQFLILRQLRRISTLKKVLLIPIKYVIRLVSDALALFHRLGTSKSMEFNSKNLPQLCSDCGLPFEKRWRDPDNPNKHLICSIIGE